MSEGDIPIDYILKVSKRMNFDKILVIIFLFFRSTHFSMPSLCFTGKRYRVNDLIISFFFYNLLAVIYDNKFLIRIRISM